MGTNDHNRYRAGMARPISMTATLVVVLGIAVSVSATESSVEKALLKQWATFKDDPWRVKAMKTGALALAGKGLYDLGKRNAEEDAPEPIHGHGNGLTLKTVAVWGTPLTVLGLRVARPETLQALVSKAITRAVPRADEAHNGDEERAVPSAGQAQNDEDERAVPDNPRSTKDPIGTGNRKVHLSRSLTYSSVSRLSALIGPAVTVLLGLMA